MEGPENEKPSENRRFLPLNAHCGWSCSMPCRSSWSLCYLGAEMVDGSTIRAYHVPHRLS
jgi:hypothetical protein